MLKWLINFALILCIPCFIQAQKIQGKVVDEQNQPIPFASIYSINQKIGTSANSNGLFYLDKIHPSEKWIISSIGFQTDTLLVKDVEALHIQLSSAAVELDEITVGDNINPAIAIIENLIENRKQINQYYKNYEVKNYIKVSLDEVSKSNPNQVMERINLIENYNILRNHNNYRHEEVIAFNDFASKSFNKVNAALLKGNAYERKRWSPINPDIFYAHHYDGDFDLYQPKIRLPKLTQQPLISPLSNNAFIFYDYTLTSFTTNNGTELAEIHFTPKFQGPNTLSGKLIINTTLNHLNHAEYIIPKSSLIYFGYVKVLLDYKSFPNNSSYIHHQEIHYETKTLFNKKIGKSEVWFEEYQFLNEQEEKFTTEIEFQSDAFTTSLTQWDQYRKNSLKNNELDLIEKQFKLEEFIQSKYYQDSIKATLSKPSFNNLVYNGIQWSDSSENNTYRLKPLIKSIQALNISGIRINPGIGWNHALNDRLNFQQQLDISFGVKNLDFKGQLSGALEYHPYRFGRIYYRVGNVFQMLTRQQSFSHIISGNNYIESKFFAIGNEIELRDGLLWNFSSELSETNDINAYEISDWRESLLNHNEVTQFQRFRQFKIENHFTIRFKQKYHFHKGEKIPLENHLPELRILNKVGLPNIMDSESDYQFLSLSIKQSVKLGLLGLTNYNLSASGFLKQNFIPIQESQYFRGSDSWFFSNPLQTFQLMNRGSYVSNQSIIEGHWIHHFNGFLMGRTPLVKRSKITSFIGASALVEEDRQALVESYFGIERTLKLDNQQYRISLSYHIPVQNAFQSAPLIKVGIDLFNFWDGKWGY